MGYFNQKNGFISQTIIHSSPRLQHSTQVGVIAIVGPQPSLPSVLRTLSSLVSSQTGATFKLAHGRRLQAWGLAVSEESLGLVWTSSGLYSPQPSAPWLLSSADEQSHLIKRRKYSAKLFSSSPKYLEGSIYGSKTQAECISAGATCPPLGGALLCSGVEKGDWPVW